MRNKNIKKAMVFITGLLIMLHALSSWFIPNNSLEGINKKGGDIASAPRNTIDYLVLGDSLCNSSISPMEIWSKYGYIGYNCGVPGQRLQYTYYTLKKLLQNQSPKLILLETNAVWRNFNYTQAINDRVNEATKDILPIYKYHSRWKYLNFAMLNEIGKNSGVNAKIWKGFHYSTVVKPYKGDPYIIKSKRIKKIQQQPLTYLNEIAALCKEKNIKLVLLSVPSPLCWNYQKHNAIEAYARKSNLPFIDLNLYVEQLGIDWVKDTRDKGNHLNFSGAKKVTNYIATALLAQNNLTDYRKDKRFLSWEEAFKEYSKITNQLDN